MAIRQRQTVLNIAIKHFKEFGLPLDIDFKSYTAIVGPREAHLRQRASLLLDRQLKKDKDDE